MGNTTISPENNGLIDKYLNIENPRYYFQYEIRKKFFQSKNGYLELATGTGKSFIALGIMAQLIKENSIDKIIIVAPGNPLALQWEDLIGKFIKTVPMSTNLYFDFEANTFLQ